MDKNQADNTQCKTPGLRAVIKLRADRVLKSQLILSSLLKYYLASSGGVKFGEKSPFAACKLGFFAKFALPDRRQRISTSC